MGKRLLICMMLTLVLLVSGVSAALAAVITLNGYDYPVEEDGWYDSMEEVAVYLCTYDQLPDNYITKKEAQSLGWVSKKGNLWDVADGCSIGGDRFGNYEGLLPDAKGRKWTECDIDFPGDYRGGECIVFSNDGLIYYTDDHYESFDEIEVIWDKAALSKQQAANTNEDANTQEEEYGTADFVVDLLDLFLNL